MSEKVAKLHTLPAAIEYPDSDGKPMAEVAAELEAQLRAKDSGEW